MIQKIIILRINQLIRLLRASGIVLIILTLAVVSGVLLQGLSNIINWPAYYSVGLVAVILFSVHLSRPDVFFIEQIAKSRKEVRLLLLAEYTLLALPILIFQTYHANWPTLGLVITVILLIVSAYPFISINKTSISKKTVPFLPKEAFEIKYKVEQKWPLFLISFLMSFLLVFHVAFLIIGVLLSLLLLMEAFTFQEPAEMIHWQPGYVKGKIFKSLSIFFSFFLFQGILSIIVYPQFIWVILYLYIICAVILGLIISYKYSMYHPLYSRIGSSATVGVFILLALLPGGILATIPYTIMHFLRAEQKMKYFYA